MPYELYHFGIKGMKWGVRKNRHKSSSEPSSKTPSKKRKLSKQNAIFYGKTFAASYLSAYATYRVGKHLIGNTDLAGAPKPVKFVLRYVLPIMAFEKVSDLMFANERAKRERGDQ